MQKESIQMILHGYSCIQGTRMQDSIYHMTQKTHFISDFCTKRSGVRHYKTQRFMDVNA